MSTGTIIVTAAAHSAALSPLALVAASLSIVRLFLAIALIGTASSTVFLALTLAAGLRNRRIGRAQTKEVASTPVSSLPFISVLKPVYGAEPRLEENLASFFLQDYPSFEIIFGCRTPADPAMTVVSRLRERYPQIPVKVIFSGEPQWPSAKVWSLEKMIASASSEFLIISDSDILVGSDFLRNVVPPLLNPANGLVTCLYQGVPAPDFWSRLEALGMSVEMPSGVMIADMLEGMQFALGPVLGVRRDALEKCGGIASTADYYSDDFVLGNRIFSAGYRVVLSHYRVGHVLSEQSLRHTFAAQTRWMQSTRYSRPKGHLGTGLTFATPFGLLGLFAAIALGQPALGFALFAWSLLNRIIQCLAIGYGLIGDPRALTLCWLYPLRDFLGFVVWIASYCGGDSFHWRGELYRFTNGGRIVSIARRRIST
jgi:ceramide glucosyltransferase